MPGAVVLVGARMMLSFVDEVPDPDGDDVEDRCLACDVTARRIIPPGGTIHEEGDWLLEHAISPVPLKGWLILKPKPNL